MSIPFTYPPLAPAFAVNNAFLAIEFYREAFGAVERYRLLNPEDGSIGHAELTINGALFMLSEEWPEYNKSPKTLGGTTVKLCLMSQDVDGDFERAIKAGADVIRPVSDQFYGHRTGSLRDPFGHEWSISQEMKVVEPEEMQRLWNEMCAQPAAE